MHQVLTGDPDYAPADEFELVHSDLILLGLRNFWHGLFPSSLMDILDEDIVFGRRKLARLIKLLVMQLHKLWMQRCSISHARMKRRLRNWMSFVRR